MTTLLIIMFLLLTIGFFIIYNRYNKIQKKSKFTNEYNQKFIEFSDEYFQNTNFENELYIWLTKYSIKMQSYLGHLGKIIYTEAYTRQVHHNYELIINTLPKFASNTLHNNEALYVNDCLIRYIGALEDDIKLEKSKFYNPFYWLLEGLNIPIYILTNLNILGNKTVLFLKNNFIYHIITLILILIPFLNELKTFSENNSYDKIIHKIEKKLSEKK